MNEIYEPVPKHHDPNALCAPEHYHVAVSMPRDKNGDLVIVLPDIFRPPEPQVWIGQKGRSRYQ